MRPSIASAINLSSFLVFVMSHTTLVLAGVSSYISGNISFPFFIAKNATGQATVTAYLLDICVSSCSIQEKSSAVL